MKMLFWLWKSKADSSGLAPIYARITVNGKSAEISTGIKVHPSRWVAKGNGYIKGSSDQIRLYNSRLNDIRSKIDDLYFDLERKEKPVTPKLLKHLFSGKVKRHYTILEVMHNLLEEKENDKDLAYSTLQTYWSRAKNLEDFLEEAGRKDMLCEEVDVQLAKSFISFLKKDKGHSQDHARKNLQILKMTMRKAVELKIIAENPIGGYRVKKGVAKPIVFLTEEEFSLLCNSKMRSRRLQQVIDLFLLQCCTGMAYAELSKLDKSQINKGIDDRQWISIERTKVAGAFCSIPLMPTAERILEKYNFQLPKITNQKYNAYLKEVAEIVGIEKHLTTHVGRKTCGMLLLNRNVPMETVSKILGHSNLRVTQQTYAQVLQHKIARDTAHINL
jgi:site-specific recombinase XerD